MKPVSVTIRCYQVGFGDCFLFSINYDDSSTHHVLIDFGSTGLPEDVPKSRLKAVANDIKVRTGGKLTAVVATHRHRDHVSGFTTDKAGSATGNVIAKLKPDLVIQPWTEDPDLAETATEPKEGRGGKRLSAAAHQVRSLSAMQKFSAQVWKEVKANRSLKPELRTRLGFLGENNISNPSAVKNLMTMTGDKRKNKYVYFGSSSGLNRMLPGVKVDVLGPPTVQQHEKVRKQTSWNKDEFWMRLAAAADTATSSKDGHSAPLFPRFEVKRDKHRFPVNARWFITRSKQLRAEQMLRIVTMLDHALNNTSTILLFQIGSKSFLFPGDAQWENWEYALSQESVRKKLESVNVYKVGHHGSRNATPKALWDLFKNRSSKTGSTQRLISLMSTMKGKHGPEGSKIEVPRKSLVNALQRETELHTTQNLDKDVLCDKITIAVI